MPTILPATLAPRAGPAEDGRMIETRSRFAAICLALPEVVSQGGQHLGFQVRGRTFAYYLDDHHGDGRTALNCKAAAGEQAALIASDPARFFVPAYLGARGWIGMYLDVAGVDWDVVAELVAESYRLIAPKRLAATVARPRGAEPG